MNRIFTFAIACVLALGTSGCATMNDTFGPVGGPIVCGLIGGALGAPVGAIASNWRSGSDHRNDQKAGYAIGAGAGNVRAVTYEYGNAYIIVAGLMNLLVVIDVYDVALGRK